ncbi:RidA family protein [Roseobacter sinensis]|uniref:RidA family protein n=1 Tax=Roseobacter sinensis TaxID=2931391 RepID=A0ABT3BE16_9RHOB|nr:RidA family protein [Roseobacter sp. WL0113]MCV3271394.1 RidA family protein [Roseobacter sp. WL0113]
MTASIDRMNPHTLPDAGKIGYSQISIASPGRLAFVSGQVAWHPDGAATPTSLADQTDIVARNLQRALDALQASTGDIVQMRICVTDLDNKSQGVAMTPIFRFLAGAKPGLTGVGVAALAGPDLEIEVEMIVQLAA